MIRSRATMLVCLVAAVGGAAITAASGGRAVLANCSTRQLGLSGHVRGATQSSLLGTLTIRNRSEHACALPPAPRRVSIMIGPQLLPTLTVRMRASQAPPGIPTRTLPARGRVAVGVRWRNWCGAPRGLVHAVLVMTIFRSQTPRLALGTVTTPSCADSKFSSTIAVSRFLKR
jgi:hypothetical protein